MDIHKRVQELARAEKITLSDLESRLNLGNGTIGKWTKSTPKVDKLYKVAQFFSLPIEYFLSEYSDDASSIESPLLKQGAHPTTLEKYAALSVTAQADINDLIDIKYNRAFPQNSPGRSTCLNGKKRTVNDTETA